MYGSALQFLLKQNLNLQELQLSGCENAVDDHTLRFISKLKDLSFIDVSYCKKVTDAGLASFTGLTLPLTGIVVSGLLNISSLGLQQLVATCTSTLVDFEAAFLG